MKRRGFTLVEMLVAIGILLILAAITMTMVNVTMDSDRIRSASRDIQSYLEGARNQAIYAKEPRGVRFLIDATDDTTVTSMVYIGSPSQYKAGSITLDAGAQPPVLLSGGDWVTLEQRGLLLDCARIKVNTSWYTMSRRGPEWRSGVPVNAGDLVVPGYTRATGFYYLCTTAGSTGATQPTWPTTTGVTVNDGTCVWECQDRREWRLTGPDPGLAGPQPYEIELAPVVLPFQEPRLLPARVAIDLDNSKIPIFWGSGPYSDRMDVMFSPRGTVTGAVGATGRLHFVLSDTADTIVDCPLPQTTATWAAGSPYAVGNWVIPSTSQEYQFLCTTGGTTGGAEPPEFSTPQVGAVIADGTATWLCHARKPSLVVSLTTQTGNVASYPLHPADAFQYAETGEVAP